MLRSLDEPEALVRFDTFDSESEARAAAGAGYRLLREVNGAGSADPNYAVYAEWQVADPARAGAFEERAAGLRVAPSAPGELRLRLALETA